MQIDAIICKGRQAASGIKPGWTMSAGTIELQHRLWLRRGFDLRDYLGGEPHWGSLNCYIGGRRRIDPLTYTGRTRQQRGTLRQDLQLDPRATRWDVKLRNIDWAHSGEPEHFYLLKGAIVWHRRAHPGWLYFPKAVTPPNRFHLPTVLEIVAPKLDFGSRPVYCSRVTLCFPDHKLKLRRAGALTVVA